MPDIWHMLCPSRYGWTTFILDDALHMLYAMYMPGRYLAYTWHITYAKHMQGICQMWLRQQRSHRFRRPRPRAGLTYPHFCVWRLPSRRRRKAKNCLCEYQDRQCRHTRSHSHFHHTRLKIRMQLGSTEPTHVCR